MLAGATGHTNRVDFSTARVGNTSVVAVAGEIDARTGYQLYIAVLEEAEAAGSARVVLDLSAVSRVDSVGLGMLVRCRDELPAQYEAILVLREPSEQLTVLLEMTALAANFAVER